MAHRVMDAHEPGTSVPLAEHGQLNDLAGEWRVTGRNLDGAPSRPGSPVVGHSAFSWLPGKFFLCGRESVAFDEQSHITFMVFGYLADLGEYRAYFFDNGGFSRQYSGMYRDRVWTFTGRYERARIEVSADRLMLNHYWERTEDGRNWTALCELSSHRID